MTKIIWNKEFKGEVIKESLRIKMNLIITFRTTLKKKKKIETGQAHAPLSKENVFSQKNFRLIASNFIKT